MDTFLPSQSSGSPNQGDNNNFKQKLLNSIIALLMVLCAIADHYHWADLSEASNSVKWILEFIALFL